MAHRRRTLSLAGAIGLASLPATIAAIAPRAEARPASAQAGRPNVLFIAVDDLNDWVGPLGGHPQARTPCLDRLAERGVLFTNAHAPAPGCNASRAAVLTGVPPHVSGVYYTNHVFREVLPDARTLPQYFRDHGYVALCAGKVFHNTIPDLQSWDEHFERPPEVLPAKRPLNGIATKKLRTFDWGPVDAEDAEMSDAHVVDWAVEQLGREHGRPFFLACGLMRTHVPWYVPRERYEAVAPGPISLPEVIEDDLDDVPEPGRRMVRRSDFHRRVVRAGAWEEAVRCYLAAMAFVDGQIGRLIDALDASPHRDDTLVVLWSDHGLHIGQKEHWGKDTLWETATRVPLLIMAPGLPGLERVQPGARVGAPVGLIDLYPTLVELCGLEPRPGLAGESLVPYLRDPDRERERPVLTTAGPGNHALRSRRWRYIRYRDGSEELYDHRDDPFEWRNLAADPAREEVVRELRRWLPAESAEPAPVFEGTIEPPGPPRERRGR